MISIGQDEKTKIDRVASIEEAEMNHY